MVNLTIDGQPVQVPEGTTVLQAAEAAGIKIPTLCNHPALKPFGGCRLCLVEVQGSRTLQPSCTLPVNEKMVVLTQTEKVKTARKFVLTLIFSDRNHFCPYCQVSGGDCELQNAALNEGMANWPYQPNWRPYPVDASHPFFVLDQNRCILCHRCVRACGQLVGNFTLGIEERGSSSMLVADTGLPLGESSCISCGTCVSVCPTGALIERHSAYQGHEDQMDETHTLCVGCSVGCGVTVFTRDNRMVRILGDWNAPVNGGILCKKGRFLPLEDQRERITTPMVKKDGALQPVSWEEAFAQIAAQMKPTSTAAQNDIAAIASPRLPVEALAIFKELFSTCLGSETVVCLEETPTAALSTQLAAEKGPFGADLDALKAADCVVLFGANLKESHPVTSSFIKRNLPNGARLVVIDRQDNGLAPVANVVLKATMGSDLDILSGIEAGLVKLGLTDGDGLAAEAQLAQAAVVTGLAEVDLLAAAGMLGVAEKPAIVYGKEAAGQGGLALLRELTQLSAQAQAALIGIQGSANTLAAAQLDLDQSFHINGQRAVYVALGDDEPAADLIDSLKQTPFLAVQASYASPLTEMAHVVLPVEMWAEQEGHYLNLEGRLQKANRALTAPAGVWSNDAVLQTLASRLGVNPDIHWEAAISSRPAPVTIIA